MERRYAAKVKQLSDQAQAPADISHHTLISLQEFFAPYAVTLNQPEQKRHAAEYMDGLLSKLEHKTGEAIAYLHDQERQGIQKFIGHVPWDHQPLLMTLARQTSEEAGTPDAVIAFTTSSFPKKGTKSVGVTRQPSGRDGKSENCQVGVYMVYVPPTEATIVNIRLHLPKEWTNDRSRRVEAGIPKSTRFHTQQELALAMLVEQGPLLPHAWVATTEAIGYPETFREALRDMGQRYLLPLASNTYLRDLAETALRSDGDDQTHVNSYVRLDRWCPSLPDAAWTEVELPEGMINGPRGNRFEAMCRLVQPRVARRGAGPQEWLFATRSRNIDGTFNHDYYLSNAETEPSLHELMRVLGAAHRARGSIDHARKEAGLADYQVRNWIAWHHHQTLSLLAARFLTLTTPLTEVHNAPTEAETHDGLDETKSQEEPTATESQDNPTQAEAQYDPIEPETLENPAVEEAQDGLTEAEAQDGLTEAVAQDSLTETEARDGSTEDTRSTVSYQESQDSDRHEIISDSQPSNQGIA